MTLDFFAGSCGDTIPGFVENFLALDPSRFYIVHDA
jgi:hypothetical protein